MDLQIVKADHAYVMIAYAQKLAVKGKRSRLVPSGPFDQ